MRYLTRRFVLGALGRRKGVEQFVGTITLAGVRGFRWVSVWPWQDGYNVSVHDVQDLDDEHAICPCSRRSTPKTKTTRALAV